MKVHYLQHVPFEGLGSMEDYFHSHQYTVTSTRLYANETPPQQKEFDCLVVMGGPMGIHDETEYPWLKDEKAFIKASIDANKPVLGICLGAQLIADVMGAQISRNPHREIGWFPISLTEAFTQSPLNAFLPEGSVVFHWHGDTFAIPEGAIAIASSEACRNQGFIYQNRVVALQFHLETTEASASALIEHCGHELDDSTYVQNAKEMLAAPQRFENINVMMNALLDQLFKN